MKSGLAVLAFTVVPAVAAAQPAPAPLPAAPSTRELERINWMELREWVPGHFTRVTDKVAGLVQDTIRKWDDAGL